MRWLVSLVLVAALVPFASARADVKPGWAATAPMNEARYDSRAVLLQDGRVLVAGGYIRSWPDQPPAQSVEIYDPATGRWTNAAPMTVPRGGFAMVRLADGRVLTAGDNGVADSSMAELYDPATNRWTRVADLGVRRNWPSLFALPDGRALVVGGDVNQTAPKGTSQIYDPATNSWSAPVYVFDGPYSLDAVSQLHGGAVLAAGGTPWPNGTHQPVAAALNLVTGTWGRAASMNTVRTLHAGATLSDGRVMVVGGVNGQDDVLTTEFYDATRNRWTVGPSSSMSRIRSLVTPLANGGVMVMGGVSPASATVEHYSPATNAWTTSTLGAARSPASATRLADGRVLVAAGIQGVNTAVATAELWTPQTSVAVGPGTLGDFAHGAPGSASVTLTNTGDQPLLTEGYALSGTHAGDYAVDGARCRVVAPGASCAVPVRLTPSDLGQRDATLTFAANTPQGTLSVALSGRSLLPGGPDADGDGVPDTADRCPKTKGAAGRSGCPAGLLADPSIAYKRVKGGIRVVAYYVKATTGARLVVKCSKKACKSTTTKGKGAKRVRITRLNNKRLKNGTSITVTVSLANRLTTTVTDRVTRGRRVEGRPRCAPVGC